ncbi:hypothetical protein CGLO_12843 [Colletotrichum gloeosporioides Cg-14]|uniref:Uncharacterized protein n=1 Tax=Colletotrichum gloeosporioides (strain Cg-14) TaxID=1237896 RepID=T0JXR8_COLGC|nr:hypothetical protein CGLO_12843 [Colletotrichum gloeosporioides Cg-14]
MPIRKKHRI